MKRTCTATTLNILLDAVAVTDRAMRKSRGILAAIDDSIQLDMSDDNLWTAADEAISRAFDFADDMPGSKRKTDMIAEIMKAKQYLRRGMQIDFSDVSKEKLKGLIIPEHNALEAIQGQLKSLIKKLGE